MALQALTFSYLLTTLPQLYFFVRTDLYFVMTNALGCKNLMGDTEGYLRNQLARRRNRPAVVDQSQLPAHEARVVRFYAWIWGAGSTGGAGNAGVGHAAAVVDLQPLDPHRP